MWFYLFIFILLFFFQVVPPLFSLCTNVVLEHADVFAPSLSSLPTFLLAHLLSYIIEQELGFAHILLLKHLNPDLATASLGRNLETSITNTNPSLENANSNLEKTASSADDGKPNLPAENAKTDSPEQLEKTQTIWQRAEMEAAKNAKNAQEWKVVYPFCIAAWKGVKEMVQEIQQIYTAQCGSPFLLQSIQFCGTSPLFWAAKSGDLETVRATMQLGM